jgi:hypothetical protein
VGGGGGGVQLGPFGTAVTYRPIVPAPGDYDDGEIDGMTIGRGNGSTQGKPLCPPQTPHACPDANPGRRGGKPATNRLSYGTALLTGMFRFKPVSLFIERYHSVMSCALNMEDLISNNLSRILVYSSPIG